MFIQNKYFRWYHSIINAAQCKQQTGYIEKHHIIPRSMGGQDKNNIVKLTAREHFICHWLLTKCVTKPYLYKMASAFHRMQNKNSKYQNSRAYEANKKVFSKCMSEFQKGRIKSKEHLSKIANAKRGKQQSEIARQNISIGKTGILLSSDHKANISAGLSFSYTLKSPSGKKFFTDSLKTFCEENNLSQKRILRTQKSGMPVKEHALSDKPETVGWVILSVSKKIPSTPENTLP
jgi:hypothetical protein